MSSKPVPTMRAVVAERAGGPEVLSVTEVPRPRPGPGQVLIRVAAIGVNPADYKVRGSAEIARNLEGKDPFPWIPGWDVAGTVERAGPGVVRFAPGDRVCGCIEFPRSGKAYAEYAVGHVSHLARVPESVSFAEAAGLPLAGLTAWQAVVDALRPEAGQRVLVTAAAGGVGHLAVQIAGSRGAHVVAAGSPANLDFLAELGAAEVVDRTAGRIDGAIEPVDGAVLCALGETREQALAAVRPGGRLSTIVGLPDTGREDVTAVPVYIAPDGYEMEQLVSLVGSGDVKVRVETLPLERAREAHERLETEATRGKIVLTVGERGGERWTPRR